MSKEKPDYEDADIALRLYDLRREAVMRKSRDAMGREFLPRTEEDLLAVAKLDHPLNTAFRQVASYWEMAFGFARHGIMNAEFLAENGGEGIFLYAKVAPFLKAYRAAGYPTAFISAEWIVNNTEAGKLKFNAMRARVEQLLKQKP